MFGLGIIDIVVIIVYFLIVVAIGIWSSRRIKGEEDYFMAGRRFGKLVQTFATFGQATSADNAVGVSTTTFTNGASGMWSSMLYLFGTPVYWFSSLWLRRLRLLTTGDFFKERYGSGRMAAVYSIIGAIGMMAFIALGFNAMAKTIVVITPKSADQFTAVQRSEYQQAYELELNRQDAEYTEAQLLSLDEILEQDNLLQMEQDQLSEEQKIRLTALQNQRPATVISYFSQELMIWMVCIIVLVYAAAGGLEAAFLTDMMQGMFIILLSVMLIPFAWAKISLIYGGDGIFGALPIIHAKLPNAFFEVFGSPNTVDFTWYYIMALSLMALLTVNIQPNQLVACGSSKGEYEARYGCVVGSFIKRICTVLWCVFGLAAIVLYGSTVPHSDLVWGHATRDLLGPLNIGLVGLMIACLMAALMSTADCLMLTCSALMTHNIYRPIVKNRTQLHYVWVGRIFGAISLLGAAWIALQFDTILQIMKFIWEMNVALVPAFWLGLKWRRANRSGAWVSIVFGIAVFLFLPFLAPVFSPALRTTDSLLKMTDPAPLVRAYTATEADVLIRSKEIERWEAASALGQADGSRPEQLQIGQTFIRTYELPRKSIFWTQGIKTGKDGNSYGKGALNLELVLLDKLGWDLSQNAYALNETFRILIRISIPILIMVVISLLTRRDDRKILDRFYARLRTPVNSDHALDAELVVKAGENPAEQESVLLFPGSNWEFYKWTREDTVGFVWAVIGVLLVLLLMQFLVNVGG